MSKRTKHFRSLAFIFTILSIACCFGPAIYYVVMGYLNASLITEKIFLTLTIFVAICGSLLCFLSRTFTFRSRIWILLLGLLALISNAKFMITLFALTQTFDELILTPLARHYRNKLSINREIDKRG